MIRVIEIQLKIIITNLNPYKRPVSAVADNVEIRNAKKVAYSNDLTLK